MRKEQSVHGRADHQGLEGTRCRDVVRAICTWPPGISDATFYKWRSCYGGMEILDARKLKALEEEEPQS